MSDGKHRGLTRCSKVQDCCTRWTRASREAHCSCPSGLRVTQIDRSGPPEREALCGVPHPAVGSNPTDQCVSLESTWNSREPERIHECLITRDPESGRALVTRATIEVRSLRAYFNRAARHGHNYKLRWSNVVPASRMRPIYIGLNT